MQKCRIPIFTVDSLPGRQIELLGCVSASCCLSKNIVQDLSSNLRNWTVGGELNQYTSMIDKSISLVMGRISELAEKAGADAVIGFRLSTSSVSMGAAEVIGYGTAVKYER
ncbi:MAG: YbjQ family protein [Aminivibrio sp.]|jgi:uncharacterized protein YbjQ (UPF0145 family)